MENKKAFLVLKGFFYKVRLYDTEVDKWKQSDFLALASPTKAYIKA